MVILRQAFGKNWARLIQKIYNVNLPITKANIDNETCIGYQDSYWFDLIDASIYRAATEADAQFAIFA